MKNDQSYSNIETILFTFEESLIHHLFLKSINFKQYGLFDGKIGIAIAFFLYGRHSHNSVYTDFADELIDGLLTKIDRRTGCGFSAGFSGIGWGIEFLIQNNFVKCDSNQVCKDIDDLVMSADIRRITDLSLETGLEGFLHYIMIRLSGAKSQNNSRPFDDLYLRDVYGVSTERNLISGIYSDFISYMDTGVLLYQPEKYLNLFIKEAELRNRDDLFSAKLGLANGISGLLITGVRPPSLNPFQP